MNQDPHQIIMPANAIRRIRGKYRLVTVKHDGTAVRIAMTEEGSPCPIDGGGFPSREEGRRFMEALVEKLAPNVSELVHGTLKKNLSSIKKHGLAPQVGQFADPKQRRVHLPCQRQGTGRQGSLRRRVASRRKDKLVYACDVMRLNPAEHAMRYHISRELGTHWPLVTHDEIMEHGLIAIVPRAPFTYKLLYLKESPIGPEPNDWFSASAVRPLRLITGEAIIEFFQVHGGFHVTSHDTWVISQFPEEYVHPSRSNFKSLIGRLEQRLKQRSNEASELFDNSEEIA